MVGFSRNPKIEPYGSFQGAPKRGAAASHSRAKAQAKQRAEKQPKAQSKAKEVQPKAKPRLRRRGGGIDLQVQSYNNILIIRLKSGYYWHRFWFVHV